MLKNIHHNIAIIKNSRIFAVQQNHKGGQLLCNP